MPSKYGKSFIWSQRIGDVAEVDAAHNLLGRHIDKQLPNRLAHDLCPQVPDAVDDGRGGEMNGPLLEPNPAELAFAGKTAPELAHVASDVFKGPANHQRCQ